MWHGTGYRNALADPHIGNQTFSMDLFAPGERSTLEPARHGESHWSYLDRSGRPEWALAREQLTEWLRRLNPPMQESLRSRLRSDDDNQFLAALWELYLHELFVRLGNEVRCEVPLPNGRNIDFLVTASDRSMYVEATAARSSAPALAADARRHRIYRELDKLRIENFMLGIEVVNAGPADMPRVAQLRLELERWLAGLDPDDVTAEYASTDALPTFDWTSEGWLLRFEAIPVSPEFRGAELRRPLGMFMDETGGIIDDETRLHRALKRKQPSGYGSLEHPFVIAIAEFGWQIGDLAWHRSNVLYGSSAVAFDRDGSSRSVRHPDGYWRGPGGRARNSRVAAVLSSSGLFPWQLTKTRLEWWDNPFAAEPVPDDLAPNVAHKQRLVVQDGTGSLVCTAPISDAEELFHDPHAA